MTDKKKIQILIDERDNLMLDIKNLSKEWLV